MVKFTFEASPELLFIGSFLIIVSISLGVICLFRLSESSWFSFGRLYVSRTLFISSSLLAYNIFCHVQCTPTFSAQTFREKNLSFLFLIQLFIYMYVLFKYYKGILFYLIFLNFTYLSLEGKGRERNTNVWLPLACPSLGTWPITHACDLTRNRTSNSLLHRPALNPLSHTIQGSKELLLIFL